MKKFYCILIAAIIISLGLAAQSTAATCPDVAGTYEVKYNRTFKIKGLGNEKWKGSELLILEDDATFMFGDATGTYSCDKKRKKIKLKLDDSGLDEMEDHFVEIIIDLASDKGVILEPEDITCIIKKVKISKITVNKKNKKPKGKAQIEVKGTASAEVDGKQEKGKFSYIGKLKIKSATSFTGKTTQALIDENSAPELTAAAFELYHMGSQTNTLNSTVVEHDKFSSTTRAVIIPLALNSVNQILDFYEETDFPSAAGTQTDTGTIYGSCGGSVFYKIKVNDGNGKFEGTMTFSSYCEEGVVISGVIHLDGKVDLKKIEIKNLSMSFDDLRSEEITLKGVISINFAYKPAVMSMDFTAKDAITEKMFWINDYKTQILDKSSYVQFTISGKLFHSDHGYVVLTTPVPFILYNNDDYPSAGILRIHGLNGTKAELRAINDTNCQLKADCDGDGTYETEYDSILWSELGEIIR